LSAKWTPFQTHHFFVVPGNRTRDPCVCSQELWPLDHRGGRYSSLADSKYGVFFCCSLNLNI
jgi:hypothetical protein